MTGAKRLWGGAVLGAIIHPCSARPLAAVLVRFAWAEQSQKSLQYQREGCVRQAWSPGWAGGRSKHGTQAEQGAGSTGPVAAPVADSPTEDREFTEPHFPIYGTEVTCDQLRTRAAGTESLLFNKKEGKVSFPAANILPLTTPGVCELTCTPCQKHTRPRAGMSC